MGRGAGGYSTQVRNGKYWPDGTFASSFLFHFAYGGLAPGARKVFERKGRARDEHIVKEPQVHLGTKDLSLCTELGLSNTIALLFGRGKLWGKNWLQTDLACDSC